MKNYIYIYIIIIFSLLSGPLSAQSIEDLLETAFAKSPLLKSSSFNASAAGEFYKKESIFKNNPVFSVAYSNVPISEWPALDKHPMSGISLGISQYIAAPWEDYYRKERLYRKYLSEKEMYNEERNLLAFQVQSAYHQIYFLYRKKQIITRNRDVLKEILKLAEALVSVNRMNSSQLLKLRADISILENRIIELDGMLSKTRSLMEKLCGSEVQWTEPDESTINQWINVEEAKEVPSGFAYENHPVYKKIRMLYEAGVAESKLEKAMLAPGVTVGLDYRIRQEIPMKDTGEDFISIMASIPIPLYYPLKERHSINAAMEREKGLKEMMKNAEIELNTRWKGENNNYQELLKAFLNFEKVVLPGYLAAYQAQYGALTAGTVNLLDVLDAYRLYLKASLEEARLYHDLVISRLRLDYLLYAYPGKDKMKSRKGGSDEEHK